jgi:hypothetical protein
MCGMRHSTGVCHPNRLLMPMRLVLKRIGPGGRALRDEPVKGYTLSLAFVIYSASTAGLDPSSRTVLVDKCIDSSSILQATNLDLAGGAQFCSRPFT